MKKSISVLCSLGLMVAMVVLSVTPVAANLNITPDTESKILLNEIALEMQDVVSYLNDIFGDDLEVDFGYYGTSLLYVYQYKETYSASEVDEIREYLAMFLNSEYYLFQEVAEYMAAAGIEDPSVVVVYRNGDGSHIIAAEYAAY